MNQATVRHLSVYLGPFRLAFQLRSLSNNENMLDSLAEAISDGRVAVAMFLRLYKGPETNLRQARFSDPRRTWVPRGTAG